MRRVASNIGAVGIFVSLILAAIWHIYSIWILYQMYGFIWAIISFILPAVSEIVIIILYGIKNGFLNYFVFGWVFIIALALISIFLEDKFSEKSSNNLGTPTELLNIECQNCKSLNIESNKYCKRCGIILEKVIIKHKINTNLKVCITKTCEKCERICDIDSVYCSSCGTLFKN